MDSTAIDNKALRLSLFPDLAKYFKHLLTQTSNETITDHLLAGLTTDALPLRVVSVWIGGFADPIGIVKAIRYEESAGVRRLAIKRFAKCLRGHTRVAALWEAVGGTPGLLQLFAELSVHDVQSFCSALGRTSTYTAGREMRQRLLTEFTESLASEHFPQAKFKNPEVRPFLKFYANIVPACTEEFVRTWENTEGLPRAGGRWTDHAHWKFVHERCFRQLSANGGKHFRLARFKNMFYELPPVPGTKGLSRSMQFSLEFLKYLGRHEEISMSPQVIQREIAIPLFRRLRRRRAPIDARAHALEIVVQALRSRMKSGDVLEFVTFSPLNRAFDIWNRNADAYEEVLVQTLKLAPKTQRTIQLDTLGIFLQTVRASYRYRLLGLFLKHFQPFSKDLESDSDIADLAPWPVNIFTTLPSERSYALLQRLIRLRDQELWRAEIFTALLPEHADPLLAELSRIRPAGNFMNWAHLHHKNPLFGIEHNKAVAILQLYISPASTGRFRGWKNIIDERKREAARARDQAVRSEWARSAILCSVASGSLDCYEDTLMWSRRFIRDPLTAPELFGHMTVCTRDGIDLLSGIPASFDASTTVETVYEDIRYANKIMLLLLETAFLAMNEPSFQPYHWRPLLQILSEVTETRLLRCDKLQKNMALSDDQVYELVWKVTLDTIVLAEGQCLMDEHEKLAAQNVSGILGYSAHPGAQVVNPAEYRFFDELARRRDELWQRHRRSKDPNVLSLQDPWPKGLAFQDLLPTALTHNLEGYDSRLPYLETRAERVVFAHPTTVLQAAPTDRDVRKAIGCYVDDYEDALDFYIKAGKDEAERKSRRQKAWDHANGALSKVRGLSRAQAILFWEPTFNYDPVWSSQADSGVQTRPDPMLPTHIEPEAPTEWNPDPQPQQWTVKAESLEPTCLDCMLQSSKTVPEPGTVLLRRPEPHTRVNFTSRAFWDGYYYRPLRTVAPAAREGLLAIGLMLINTKCCPSKRLFARPFPSSQDPRFPSIYLNEEFLDRDDISIETGFVILERLVKDAPLTLVAELCEAMLANLGQNADGRRDFEEETLRLLKILVDSDRPNLALDLIRKVVIERPDASSWHRHMLTKGLFDRLKSNWAHRFIWELALSIKTRLQEQAQRKPMPEGEAAKPSSPLIKVTTVTALAQLLSEAKFVSGQETVDILCDIFANASHPDIRVAIIQSLTSILAKSRLDSVREVVIQALEHYAVPVASSMSERSPLTEEDWQKAESELDVPEVNDAGSKALQPVLSAIVETYGAIEKTVAEQLYHRILLPVLQTSASNNRRWTRIFLRKLGLSCDVDALPLIPPKPRLLSDLTKRDFQEQRSEIFTIRGEAVLTNLDPPPDLAEANAVIANDMNLRNSNVGKHWSSLWNNPGTVALSLAGPELHRFYLTSPDLGKAGPVPIPLIQSLVLRQLHIMIQRSDERFMELEYILTHLKRPEHKNENWERTWEANVRPLIKRVADEIESLRTPQWQRDSRRSPRALRDTYDLRLSLLTWPSWDAAALEKPDHGDRLAIFAEEIENELRQLAGRREPYHDQFYKLKHTVRLVNPRDYCYLALHLGMLWMKDLQQNQGVCLTSYLGLEMAEVLLKSAAEPGSTRVIRDVVKMLQAWKASTDEIVRMSGLRTWRMYEDERERSMKWFWKVKDNMGQEDGEMES